MGLFYSNFTLYGPDQERVLDALRVAGRTAFVSPSLNGFTTVYDQETEGQDLESIERVGSELSRRLDCPIFGVALHDDDVLYCWLFRDGESADFYNSCPDYFDPDADVPQPPEGGDAVAWCNAFAVHCEARVEAILRAEIDDEEGTIPGEEERHQELAEALGMPLFPVGLGYDGLDQGYLPARHTAMGLTLTQFCRVTQA